MGLKSKLTALSSTIRPFIVITVGILVAHTAVNDVIWDWLKDDVDLAVCVLSARQNLEFRDAVRQSWLTDIDKIREDYGGSVVAKFVVGSSACPLHVDDRISPNGCKKCSPQLPSVRDGKSETLVAFVAKPEASARMTKVVTSLYVMVMHPIYVQRLGLAELFPLEELAANEAVQVVMYDAATEEEVSRVHFKGSNKGRQEESYYYRPIEGVSLPKDYEFTLELELNSNRQVSKWWSHLDGQSWMVDQGHHNLIYIEYVTEGLTVLRQRPDVQYVPLISFAFMVEDIATLESHISGTDLRAQHRSRDVEDESRGLREEQSLHGDLLEVPLVDVYTSLPDKVLFCHKWFAENYHSRYVVKTDDDCWLNMPAIFSGLRNIAGQTRIWWGNFRTGWTVERHGKWRENHYTALTYPSFACGSGSVISRDLHSWLASNHRHFQRYQGEDISMAIWLAALEVDLQHDLAWRCDGSCREEGTLALPQLSPSEVVWYWNNSRHCTSPCGPC